MAGAKTRNSWTQVWVLAVFLTAGLGFWAPGYLKAHAWPAPLDDTFIYYGFARSTALGSPLAWVPGNGFSSGATSLLYPLLLAPFWALGLRGAWLGLGAAVLALGALVDLDRSLARVLGEARATRGVRLVVPLVVVAIPLLDWSLFSGMETAFFSALLGRAVAATDAALAAPIERRARAQWIAGAYCAALPLGRPEAALVGAFLGVAVVHGARSFSTARSSARALLPLPLVVGAQFGLNRAFTGEWQAAGAVRKLLTASPFLSGEQLTLEVAKNLAVLASQAFLRACGGTVGFLAWLTLCTAGLVLPRHRRLSLALVLGAVGALVLVALNATARFQNYRYAAPSLLMLLIAALLGASSLAESLVKRGSRWSALGLAPPIVIALLAPLREWPKQTRHFAQASANIAEQQVELGRRLAAQHPKPQRVLVGDAGAIPYISELPALDGLGLGGYHDLPFARASLHGDAATVELIERLPKEDRPDWMAVYPGWWGTLVDRFGTRVDSVRIRDNVICAAEEKVLYRARFDDLAPPNDNAWPDARDRLDLADLVSERAHDLSYVRGVGGTVSATRNLENGQARWDGGRYFPDGVRVQFVATLAGLHGSRVVLRTDARAEDGLVVDVSAGRPKAALRSARLSSRGCTDADRWCDLEAALDTEDGDTLELTPRGGALRVFHVVLDAQTVK